MVSRIVSLVLVVFLAACAPAGPERVTVCELAAHPNRYDGREVQVAAELSSNGHHFTVLHDPACGAGSGIALLWSTDRAGAAFDQIYRVIYRTGLQGTIDKRVSAVFVGEFVHAAGERSPRRLELHSLTELKVEILPVPSAPIARSAV